MIDWVGWHSAFRVPSSTKRAVQEGMGANQLCRIAFGISSQIGRDDHRDMGDVSMMM